MRVFRGFLAMVCLVVGMVALALWGGSMLVVRSVEDGALVTGIAQRVVEQPAFKRLVTERAQLLVTGKLSESGINLEALGLKGAMDDVVATAVESDTFQRGLIAAVEGASEDFADQLTSPESEGQPLILQLDVSAAVNQSLAGTPVLGDIIPQLSFEPLPLPVAEADSFDRIRGTYRWIDRMATWAGWIGLGLIAAGIALTPRKRWLVPLGLLGAGLSAGALWAVVRWLTVERIADRLPGGADGDLGSALVRFANQDSLDRFGHRLFLVAAACLVGALVSFIVVKVVSRPANRGSRADGPRGRHEENTPEHAR